MQNIKIKYHAEDLEKIKKIAEGDWIDLRASEDISIEQGNFAMIPLGISTELPDGFEAHLAPRSSTFKNYGLIVTNSFGIIDNTFRGIWHLPVFALDRRAVIKKNDRICQFRLVKNQPAIEFIEVDSLSETTRSDGGFGSTGIT